MKSAKTNNSIRGSRLQIISNFISRQNRDRPRAEAGHQRREGPGGLEAADGRRERAQRGKKIRGSGKKSEL